MTIPASGGQLWPGGYGNNVGALDDLTDVETTAYTPTDGDVLYYDGTRWRPASIVTASGDVLVDGSGNVIYT